MRRTLTIASRNHVRTGESALTKSTDTRATAKELDIWEINVRKISTNALEVHVKTMAFVSTTTVPIHANVEWALAVSIANKLLTNASRHLVFTVAPALRRKKVTLNANVEKVFRDSFVKYLRNALIVLVTRNVWMVGVCVNTA